MERWRRLLLAETVKLRRLRLIWFVLGLLLLFVGLAYYLSHEGYQTILDRMRAEEGVAPGLQAMAARACFLSLLKQMITLPRAVDVAFGVLHLPGFLMITLVAAGIVAGGSRVRRSRAGAGPGSRGDSGWTCRDSWGG